MAFSACNLFPFSLPYTAMSRHITPTLCALLTGGLYALALTNYLDGPPLGYLAWFALIPLHVAIDGLPPRQAFWRGWLVGVMVFVGTVYWVITAMHQYGQVPIFISILLMLLLAIYLGLYIGLYSLGCALMASRWPKLIFLGAPSLWVSLEFLRTYLLSGLPWGLLGYSQFRALPIIQIADITGVYGVSFLVVLGNVALFMMSRQWIARHTSTSPAFPWKECGASILLIFLVLMYGTWQLNANLVSSSQQDTLRIGLVQANIEQARKWDAAFRGETMARYANLTMDAASRTDLVIWPEAATPFLYEQEISYQALVRSLVQQTQVPLVFGSPVLQRHPDGKPYLFNSVYTLDLSGEITGRYDKQHLVPFGEFIPLRWLLFFLDKLVVGIGDFEPGSGPTLLSVPQSSESPPLKFGVAICFEVIFPNLVRALANQGANFLVTVTNDAWFGDTVAPYQHFGMVVLRAVENRMAFARAANTGISGFIAPTGEIVSATPIFTQQVMTGSIPLRTPSSFYTLFGDIFAWACVILSVILLWLAGSADRSQSRLTGSSPSTA